MAVKRNIVLSIITRIVVCLVLFAVAFGIFGLLVKTAPVPGVSDDARPAQVVQVMPAQMVEVKRQWSGFGTARAMDAADVPARVSATVMQPREIEPGMMVQRGELLVKLDETDFQFEVDISTEAIADIARPFGTWILCDEVYRGTDQAGDGMTASMADIYERGISTAGMSKAFSLAGLRLGWVAAPQEVIEAVSVHRDYDTISVGMIDDHFAALALEHRDAVLTRSHAITRGNLKVLEDWVEQEPRVSWVKPRAGTTALLRYDLDMRSRELCIALLEQTGVMFTPGSALDIEGYVRIGYANNPAILKEGLSRVSGFLAKAA